MCQIQTMNDPQIISAIIQSLGGIVSALVAASAASINGKKFLKQEKLKKDIQIATKDIEFLLEIEKMHCDAHNANHGTSNKNSFRDQVRENGFAWSGRFTPGRVKNP